MTEEGPEAGRKLSHRKLPAFQELAYLPPLVTADCRLETALVSLSMAATQRRINGTGRFFCNPEIPFHRTASSFGQCVYLEQTWSSYTTDIG